MKYEKIMTYQVLWREFWFTLSKYMAMAVSIPVLAIFAARYAKYEFNFSAAFPHLNLINSLEFISGAMLFCTGFSLLIALWARMAKITIRNNIIHGRNYWGFKNSFPLVEVVSSYKFSNSGMNFIVLVSKNSGKIFISVHTERLNNLLELVEPFILNNEKNS